MGANAPIGKRFPYVRPPYHHVFGPPTPGRRRSAATLRLKMAKNGPLEAEMGPKGAKSAQNAPKCPQNDSKPRCKVPLRKATLSPCVWAPESRPAPVGGHKTAKNGQKWAKAVPKGPKCPKNEPKPRTKVCLCKATLSPCLSREVEGLVGWDGRPKWAQMPPK